MRSDRTTRASLVLLAVLGVATPALAQDQWTAQWTLDTSLANFTTKQKEELVKGVQQAPQKALQAVLKEEGDALADLTKDELEAFAKASWDRVRQGKKDGHLWRAICAELKAWGVYSEELAEKVWEAERARIDTIPERAVYGMVDRLFKALLLDRIRAVRNARLEAARVTHSWGDGRNGEFPLEQPRLIDGTRETDTFNLNGSSTDPGANVDLRSDIPWPKVKFFTEKFKLEETLYDKTFKSELGDLRVTAAKVEGLANATAGRVAYTNEFGQEVEGLGVTFTARAKVTGARGQFTSKDLTAKATNMRVRSRVTAIAEAASVVEATSTTVVNEEGIGTHNVIRAGAGTSATLQVPIVVDLKLFKLHVIPYVTGHAGASAEAHASFEVEWSGMVRLDLGAHASWGVGAGAGIIVQLELGDVLKKALDRVITYIANFVRPVADAIMGRTWRGPSNNSNQLTLSLADLERAWADRGDAAPERDLTTPEAIAARYAPVLYQRVERGPFDYLRRIDYDGDWNTENNFNNTTNPDADTSAWVYYDVKETETHYYVCYVLYHSGRKSNSPIRPIRNMIRHENDLGGVTVVARKGAPRGREIEVVMTHNGDATYTYSGLEKQGGDRTRWRTDYGHWSGPIRFVDEATHPLFDEERTHPQIWVDGKDHDVYGFTGRDDVKVFSGKTGIVYAYTGSAGRPESDDDRDVGYALRPLDELFDRRNSQETFSHDRDHLVRPRGAHVAMPGRLQGDEGYDDQIRAPWAWRYWQQEEEKDNDRSSSGPTRSDDEWIEEGDVFVDPARVVSILFRTPDDFGRRYVRNRYVRSELRVPPAPADATGMTEALDEASSGQ